MDCERVQKPPNQQQSGGFSPSKLRAILLGIEKKQKEELESGLALRSEADEIEDRVSLSKHDSASSVQSSPTFIAPPTVKSVSMRDMGTEMTPIASQEASRTGTPNRSSTPTCSPNSSRPLSPARIGPISSANEPAEHLGDSDKKELFEKELKMKTRREIMVLGQQLGKMSIAAWASKEEEESDETVQVGQPTLSVNEARKQPGKMRRRPSIWLVLYLKPQFSILENLVLILCIQIMQFKQEEIKIQAWENHQKAKTEAEMRKIEVEVERMRARAHEKLMNQLAAARHKSEEKRAAAEAKRNQQAARTAQQAEFIRRTAQIPTSFACWSWCS